VRPKPMVEIGGKPMLWHIMKIYAAHGIEEFVICLGYKGYLIKEYFANYYLHTCDVSFDLANGDMEVHRSETEPWRVTLVDTGEQTMTGGRLKRVLEYVGDEDFCFTYGDGLSRRRHHGADRLPPRAGDERDGHRGAAAGRFGALDVDGERVREFEEKPRGRRRLDQRRLLRALAGDRSLHRRRSTPSGSRSRCARSRARASSPATATRASGRRWTRCATATSSRSCGARARLPGGRGPSALMATPGRGTVDPDFWRERRVLLTGHTGFKGAWLALWLQSLGAA
jgi:hypothetical protein